MPKTVERETPSTLPSGPLNGTAAGRLLAKLAEPIYRKAITRRNLAFDAGIGVNRLDRPVISIGNLSVGGTGKTPMVAKIVGELQRAGRRPCIAMRGYGKKNPAGRSDEAEEYARLLPGVPVVAQPDRHAGLQALFATPEGKSIDIVVLDDGFQHRKIRRDVDIVLIDATATTFDDHLLPLGWLREPVASLARADAVVITRAERIAPVDRIRAEAFKIKPSLAVSACRHVWTGFRTGDETLPRGVITAKKVAVVCAIGNPDALVDAVKREGAKVERVVALRDHDPYGHSSIKRALQQAEGMDAIITTEKDWVKLGRAPVSWPCPVYRPVLELSFIAGWDDLWSLIRRKIEASPTLQVTGSSGANTGAGVEGVARGS